MVPIVGGVSFSSTVRGRSTRSDGDIVVCKLQFEESKNSTEGDETTHLISMNINTAVIAFFGQELGTCLFYMHHL